MSDTCDRCEGKRVKKRDDPLGGPMLFPVGSRVLCIPCWKEFQDALYENWAGK